jgi:hypothetical protein
MYWVGGVTVDPTESPGLASALLDAVAQQPRQTIVFVDRYRLHEYVIATSRWLETEFEAPYHLYRVFCKGPRPAVRRIDQPFFDERVFSEVVKQLEQERHLQQRASAVVSDVTVIPTSEGESNE